MKLCKNKQSWIQSYLEEQIDVEELVKNGDVRVGNFLVVYTKTVNEDFDPEYPDDGDPEWWFDIDVVNDVNDATQRKDHVGSASMTEFYGGDADIYECFNNAMRNFFDGYDWQSDEWSLKTFGF